MAIDFKHGIIYEDFFGMWMTFLSQEKKNTRKMGKNLSKHLSISGFAKKLIFDSRAQDWSTRNDEHGKARKIGQDPES